MIIYDIEIKKAIQGRNQTRYHNIEYCAGWDAYDDMGISVICAYDMATKRSRVFMEDNFAGFKQLAENADCLVGFNSLRFDNRVLEANGINLPRERCYDLLIEIWRSLGLSSTFNPKTHGGYNLEAMAYANFRTKKTGDGALAPVDFQRGNIGKVIDYCLTDVYLTHRLLERVINCGYLFNPKNEPQKLFLRKPNPEMKNYA